MPRKFAQVPICVIGDRRLSGSDRAVLDTLIAFADRQAWQAWPSRQVIGEITNLQPPNVSRSIRRLLDMGYLSKPLNAGGRGRTTVYSLHIPPYAKGVNYDTVLTLKGVESDTQTVSYLTLKGVESDTQEVVTGKEQDNNRDNKAARRNRSSAGPPKKSGSETIDVQPLADAWNAMATKHRLPCIQSMNATRRKHAQARIRKHGLDRCLGVLAMIPESSFLLGTNNSGWRANFDFFIRESSFDKLAEGSYRTETDSERMVRELEALGHTIVRP